jgi:HAD superfamily hydrolase (TIGR01509 family)
LVISHVIFDCDGVLIDSEKISMDVDLALLAQSGIDFTEAEMHHRFVGTTFEAMIAAMELEFGKSLPKDLSARKDDLMLELYRRDLKTVPGVIPLLQQLHLPKSIGTNGPRHRAIEALRMTGLEPFFGDRLTTFEDVKYGKPAPDIYQLAAFRAGFAPNKCLVVEDSATGVMAARAAGCRVIGFTGVAHDPVSKAKALEELGVLQVVNRMEDLLPAISALGA